MTRQEIEGITSVGELCNFISDNNLWDYMEIVTDGSRNDLIDQELREYDWFSWKDLKEIVEDIHDEYPFYLYDDEEYPWLFRGVDDSDIYWLISSLIEKLDYEDFFDDNNDDCEKEEFSNWRAEVCGKEYCKEFEIPEKDISELY